MVTGRVRSLLRQRRDRGRARRHNIRADRFPRRGRGFLSRVPSQLENGVPYESAHVQCSSQKRSLRYFAAESAKTVTMTAC